MTLIQEMCELDRLALDFSSPGQKGDVVLGLVVILPAESTWGRIAAGEQAGHAHRADLSVNQLQVTAGSLGYTPVTALDSVSVMHVSCRRTLRDSASHSRGAAACVVDY